MAYHISLIDRAQREALIKQSLDASAQFEDFYDFRDQKTQLKVVRIPIEVPIYRMENFRTFSEQTGYVAKEGKPQDFFSTGQENESTQQVQHEILVRLAEKGKANSVVPVIDVLRREGQRDTLLITQRGVVVNGNRRLAAMRELFAGDQVAFHQFSHVSCKVLPADTTPSDILDIEAKLQAKPETRLDYDWIGDAELLTAMVRAKGSPDAVAKFLGRKPKEVKNALQALAEADLYLIEWARAPRQYDRVADRGEQFFKDLPTQLANKPLSLQDASRAIAWTLFDNGEKLSGRLYNYNVAFGQRAEEVLNQLSEELGISIDSPAQADNDDSYDFDLGADEQEPNYDRLIEALKSDTNTAVIDALVDACDNVIATDNSQRSGRAALKSINTANAKLAEVDITRASKDTFVAILRQLASIIQRATDLQARVLTAQAADVDKPRNS